MYSYIQDGYLNTRNYVGSWLEWCEKEGIDNNED
jgi:3-mercaptopyruvate sulfurtransferase SseA